MAIRKKSVSAASKYEPNAEERSALQALARGVSGPTARMKVSHEGSAPTLKPDHPDEMTGIALLAQSLGTSDIDFVNGILSQLANAGSTGGEVSESGLNFMLSVVKGVKPTDEVEAMLAAQMAAVHMATMTFARRLAHVENIPQQDSAERAFNKLARTFATQMEALKRYRTGGEQKVTVQHVSVSEGGQAIVGNVTQSPAPGEKAPNKVPTAALTHSQETPMPMLKKSRKSRERVSTQKRQET